MHHHRLSMALTAVGRNSMAYVAVVVAVTATGVMVSAMVLAAVMPIEQAIKNSHTPRCLNSTLPRCGQAAERWTAAWPRRPRQQPYWYCRNLSSTPCERQHDNLVIFPSS